MRMCKSSAFSWEERWTWGCTSESLSFSTILTKMSLPRGWLIVRLHRCKGAVNPHLKPKWPGTSWLVWTLKGLPGGGWLVWGVGVWSREKDSSELSVWSNNFHVFGAYDRDSSHGLYHLILTTELWTEFYYPHFTDGRSGLKRLRNVAKVTELVGGRAGQTLSSQAAPKT